MKGYVITLFSIIAGLLTISGVANAVALNDWQSTADGSGYTYYWTDRTTGETLSPNFVASSTFAGGTHFWYKSGSGFNQIDLTKSDSNVSYDFFSLSDYEGYKLWALVEYDTTGCSFKYTFASAEYHHDCVATSTIDMAEGTMKLEEMAGVGSDSGVINISDIYFSNPYNTHLYFLVYTDQNLKSLLTNETAVWQFIVSNSLIGSPPLAPDFANKDFGLLGNFFRDVLIWLFYPSNLSAQNFQSLSVPLQQKAPFAYFYSIKNSLSLLSSTTTPTFALSTTTGALNTSIFQPIKTGLTWILWLMFAVWLIKRIGAFDF